MLKHKLSKAALYKLVHPKPEKGFKVIGYGNESDDGDLIGQYEDYFLWNQNGFNNALYYHYDVQDWDDKSYKGYSPKKYARQSVHDCYPKRYPCFMRIWGYHTFESGRLIANFEY